MSLICPAVATPALQRAKGNDDQHKGEGGIGISENQLKGRAGTAPLQRFSHENDAGTSMAQILGRAPERPILEHQTFWAILTTSICFPQTTSDRPDHWSADFLALNVHGNNVA